MSADVIVTRILPSFSSAFVVEPATVLGQLPPRLVICSPAEPEPAPAEPEPAAESEPAEPEPAEPAVSEPEPAIVSEPVEDPEPVVVADPEPSVVPVPPLSFLQAGAISKQSPIRAVAILMTRMLHAVARIGLALAVLAGSAIAAPDIKLPPGTRADASGQLVSTRGLRDTSDFIAKELDRRGIVVTKVGPVRIRGVELTRFISATSSTTWLAIHVLRNAGKTVIFFVPRPVAKSP